MGSYFLFSLFCRVPQVRFSTWVLGFLFFMLSSRLLAAGRPARPGRDRSAAPTPPHCHPDRSGPIFSSAPNCGASGREVEGSWRDPDISPRFSIFGFRISSFAPCTKSALVFFIRVWRGAPGAYPAWSRRLASSPRTHHHNSLVDQAFAGRSVSSAGIESGGTNTRAGGILPCWTAATSSSIACPASGGK